MLQGNCHSLFPRKSNAFGDHRTASFEVADGRFVNRCNGVDFRFSVIGDDLTIRRVVIRKLK